MHYTDYTAFNSTVAQLTTTIICHFTLCLLHVAALAWPLSGRSPRKECSNGIFC